MAPAPSSPARQRDLFPLPAPDWHRGDLRRALRQAPPSLRGRLRQQVDGVAAALSEIYAEQREPRSSNANAVQRAAHSAILQQLVTSHSEGAVYHFRESAEILLKTRLSYHQ